MGRRDATLWLAPGEAPLAGRDGWKAGETDLLGRRSRPICCPFWLGLGLGLDWG